MQLSERILARRYAEAFYQAAAGGGEADAAVAELASAQRALRDKLQLFRHPRVSAAEKKSQLRRLASGLSPRTIRFLELLVDKKRFGLLPQLAAEAGRVHDERQGVARAAARCAAELSPEELVELRRRLKAFCGREVVVEAKVDPELLAGVVVRMGDWVLDASLQGRLRSLARQWKAED